MTFRNGRSLRAEYEHSRVRRTRGIVLGLFAGGAFGAITTGNVGVAVLAGLLTAILIGIQKSREINDLEKIIYPGEKQ